MGRHTPAGALLSSAGQSWMEKGYEEVTGTWNLEPGKQRRVSDPALHLTLIILVKGKPEVRKWEGGYA